MADTAAGKTHRKKDPELSFSGSVITDEAVFLINEDGLPRPWTGLSVTKSRSQIGCSGDCDADAGDGVVAPPMACLSSPISTSLAATLPPLEVPRGMFRSRAAEVCTEKVFFIPFLVLLFELRFDSTSSLCGRCPRTSDEDRSVGGASTSQPPSAAQLAGRIMVLTPPRSCADGVLVLLLLLVPAAVAADVAIAAAASGVGELPPVCAHPPTAMHTLQAPWPGNSRFGRLITRFFVVFDEGQVR